MKKLTSLLLIFLLGLSLTGCKKKASKASENANRRLQIWTTADAQEALRAIGREFSGQPEYLGTSFFVLAFDTHAQLQEFLVDQMAEGMGPDIVYTTGDWVIQNRNKLEEFEEYEIFSAEKFNQTFVRAATDALVHEDEIYGVPMGIDSLAVIYNEDHLATVLPDRNSPGATWTEFKQDVETLNRPDNSFKRFAISGAALGRTDNIVRGYDALENIMVQMGTSFFNPEGTRVTLANSTGINEQGVRENYAQGAVGYFTSFADERFDNYSWSEVLADPLTEEKDMAPFLRGEVSMIFGYATDYEKIKGRIGSLKRQGLKTVGANNVRVGFLPQANDPAKTHSREVVAKVYALAVPSSAKNEDLAWRFLHFSTQKDQLKSFYEKTHLPTPRLSLIPEQEAEVGTGIYVRQAKFARLNPLYLPESDIQLAINEMVSHINENKLQPLEGLRRVETLLNKQLSTWNNRRSAIDREIKAEKRRKGERDD